MKKTFALVLALACCCMLPACSGDDSQAAAQAAAQTAAQERAADAMEQQFKDAVAHEDWRMAKSYGEVLLMDHPTSAAAERIQPLLDDVRAKADVAQQQRRLAALWDYVDSPVTGGHQLSASLYSQEPVDTDGSGVHPVQLIFRDHPSWGRSAYLVLEAGDFDCYKGCQLKVVADGKTHTLPGSRPNTDEAIAMFIDDYKTLWKLAKTSKQVSIEFPTQSVGKRRVDFEVGGLDASKLPKWN